MIEANQNHIKMNKTIHQVMPYYYHSETRCLWWKLFKTNNNFKTNYTNWCHVMSIQEQDLYDRNLSNPYQNDKQNTTSSDVKLWAFRNKISMTEANQNQSTTIKHNTSSDARLCAFRNDISMIETNKKTLQHNQKRYIKWCQRMSIQKTDLDEGGWLNQILNDWKLYIKWCQIISIQKQHLHCGSQSKSHPK